MERTHSGLISFFLIVTVFFLPISSSAKSIFLSLALLLIMLSKVHWHTIINNFKQPWCISALALFGFIYLSSFWSVASWHDTAYVLEKYLKLLFLPFLVAGFANKRTHRLATWAFLMAMLVTCIFSIMYTFNIFAHHDSNIDPHKIFRNHIMTGYMMAIASYLALHLFIETKKPWIKFFLLGAFIVFTYQIFFLNIGRTGYICYFLVIALFGIQYTKIKYWFFLCLVFFLGFSTLYHSIDSVHERVNRVFTEYHKFNEGIKNTSIGFRLQFHQYSKQLFLKKPLIGHGAGGFAYSFIKDDPIPSWHSHLNEPHSQYWLMLVDFGLIGLILLIIFFTTLGYSFYKVNGLRAFGFAVLIPFIIINFTDSLLFYSGTGYLFITLMAISLANQASKVKVLT